MGVQQAGEEIENIDEWVWDDLTQERFVRSIAKAGGSGGFAVGLPIEECREEGLDTSKRVLVVPSDLAGQLGLNQDPLFEIYGLPLER